MLTAEELNLDINHGSIMFVGTHTHGQGLKMTVENGCNVTLKKDEIKIEIKNLEKLKDGIFKGIIQYVEPYKSLQAIGANDGVEMSFSYDHIFLCSYK